MTTVHIVGGGVSGVALASCLPTDWDVHLHEAQWQARQVPTLFGLHKGGQEALRALNVLEGFTAHSAPVSTARMRNGSGRILTQMKGLDVRLISRPDLLNLLLERLPESVQVHHGRISDPTELRGDLIIGADGVHSVVRSRFWGAASAPRSLSVTVIRGVIREEIEVDALEEIWRPDGLFGVTPHPDGGANWFATVPQTRFDSRALSLEALRQRWNGHSELPQAVLRFASPELTLVNDLWESRWPRRLNQKNAVLLGDAAHAMSPNLGRGANESLIDAVTLGSALSGTPLSLRRAIRHYQRRRSLPPHMIRIASRVMLRLASTSREGLRDGLFRPMNPRL